MRTGQSIDALTQSDAGTWRFSLSSATNGAVSHVKARRAVFDPLNSNKRQPQLNESALAQRVADGFNDIPASVSLARLGYVLLGNATPKQRIVLRFVLESRQDAAHRFTG